MPNHPLTYLDFDLAIEILDATANRHRVRVLNSPAGQATGEFTLPFDARDLELLFLRLGRPRRGVRRIGSPEMAAAQDFGSTLYAVVFTGAVQTCLQRSLDIARSQNKGVRLRLRLSDAPALTDLPWEFLFDTNHNHFLAYSTATPIVRYLDLPQGMGPLAVEPPLKILVMIANPRDYGYEPLDVEAEWQKVQGALAELEEQGLVEVTRLEAATLSALQRQLRRDSYHIFHFVGHGGFDEASQNGVLLLEEEDGRSRMVSGHYLGALLRDHFSLRLALLNACEGARTSRVDPFAGVAQHLVQQGTPAVIAMQFEITDPAAITLAHEFYGAVADGYPVDAALSEARKAIYAAGNDIEWGTPVLYMRAQSAELFHSKDKNSSFNNFSTTQQHKNFLSTSLAIEKYNKSMSYVGHSALASSGSASKIEPLERNELYSKPPAMSIQLFKFYYATFKTDKGDIKVQLFADRAPVTVNNFVFLAREGYYNDTSFHRVLKDFMAQGGDPTGTGNGGPGYQFEDEIDPSFSFSRAGLLAMANAGPNTNGSQFFITFAPTEWLNNRHTIFGEVIDGLDVLTSLTVRDPNEKPGFDGDTLYTVIIEIADRSTLPLPSASRTFSPSDLNYQSRPLAKVKLYDRPKFFTTPPEFIITNPSCYL